MSDVCISKFWWKCVIYDQPLSDSADITTMQFWTIILYIYLIDNKWFYQVWISVSLVLGLVFFGSLKKKSHWQSKVWAWNIKIYFVDLKSNSALLSRKCHNKKYFFFKKCKMLFWVGAVQLYSIALYYIQLYFISTLVRTFNISLF